MALLRGFVPKKVSTPLMQQVARVSYDGIKAKIGNREVVGWGINGQYNYVDHIAFPMPAIRWRETTPEIQALKDKEKGDWKKLSIEEKKALYRASFCQTYSEMRAPTGQWKGILGIALGMISLSWWIYIWEKLYVYPPMPDTITDPEKQAEVLRFMINNRVDPIDGLTSKWDYENNRWKK